MKKLIINSWHVKKKKNYGYEHHIDKRIPKEVLNNKIIEIITLTINNYYILHDNNKIIIKEIKKNNY